MSINIDDINFTWQDDEKRSFFSEVGEETAIESSSTSLNLDTALVAYKKTTLTSVVSYFMKKNNLDISNNKIFKFLAYTILFSIYPKATKLEFSDENDFKNVVDLFKTNKLGMQFIEKADIDENEFLKETIELLLLEGIVVDRGNKFIVKGYFLDSLTINNS